MMIKKSVSHRSSEGMVLNGYRTALLRTLNCYTFRAGNQSEPIYTFKTAGGAIYTVPTGCEPDCIA